MSSRPGLGLPLVTDRQSLGTNMQTSTELRAPSTAGRREWLGLAVLALPTLLLSLDMSVLYLALPQISTDLAPSGTQQLWIMDSYGFLLAGFLITMGTLGDRIGRRRLLMIGAAAFTACSVLAAYSFSAEMLIVTRALMGVAGATLMPSTLALITNMFRDTHQRSVAIAVWMSCFMGGMSIGPLVGGVMLAGFWWGSVFLLGVPVMLVLLLAAPALLPEHRDDSAGSLDLASVGLSLATILPVIYGLKELAQYGVEPAYVVTIGAGLAAGVAFVRRQRRLVDPLIDVALFRRREFSAALGINLSGGVVMAGTFLLLSLYLQMVLGYSPLTAGLCLVPMNVAMAVASNVTPHLAKRIRPTTLMAAGLVIAAAGLLMITQVRPTDSLPLLMVGFSLASVGIAMPTVLGMGFIMGSVPPERAGSASGISETSGEFGIALGVATIGSLGASIYRAQLSVPPGVPENLAATARESITGAMESVRRLPDAVAADLLASAREAFTSGLNMAGGVGAVLLLAMTAVALSVLRDIGSATVEPDAEVEPDADDGTIADEPEAVLADCR